MNDVGLLIGLYTETPLHAGAGQGAGAVDLPIQRERISSLPMVQGSGLKGALREELETRRASTEGDERTFAAFLSRLNRLLPRRGLDTTELAEAFEALFKEDSPQARSESQPDQEKLNAMKDDVVAVLLGEASSPEAAETWASFKGWYALQTLFGPAVPDAQTGVSAAEMFAGSLMLSDVRLLLLPVRALRAGWAWTTCPMILERLGRDLERLGGAFPIQGGLTLNTGTAWVAEERWLAEDKLILEDFAFGATKDPAVATLAGILRDLLPDTPAYQNFRNRLAKQLVILSDEDFCFLAQHGTEVTTRIRMDERTGTVARGALWAEEALPAESLLWSVATFSSARQSCGWKVEALPALEPGLKAAAPEVQRGHFLEQTEGLTRMQLGGDRTTGRGVVGLTVKEPVQAAARGTGLGKLPTQTAKENQQVPRLEEAAGKLEDIERARARWAWETVVRVEGRDKAVRDTYGTLARKLPTLLQEAGLGQSLAFLHAHARVANEDQLQTLQDRQREGGRASAYGQLLADLSDRLRQAGFQPGGQGWNRVLELDEATYRAATREAMVSASWLKRLAEGKLDASGG